MRSETNLTRWLAMDTTFNSRIGNTNEFYGGLRVNLAFDLYNLFNRRGQPFFSAPSHPESNNNYLEDRIFDRVVRDIDIQSKTSTRQTGSSGQTQTVESLIFVNNATGSDTTGTGTRSNPYATIGIALGVATGGQWVYVEGQGASNYAGGISLSNAQVLWGSGYNGGFSGLTVSGVSPVINGGANGITLHNNNTVMGVQVQNATNDGIKSTPGQTLTGTIKYNSILGSVHDGIDLSGNNGSMDGFVISHNTITNSQAGNATG
ncbi:MAG: DUF1565 domain-containing protein, partial [Candidatus Omnitrophica bacterium]|nr:DUF1565 domain-containing protein [Candidatus Omnitrophota bacterium]